MYSMYQIVSIYCNNTTIIYCWRLKTKLIIYRHIVITIYDIIKNEMYKSQ